MINREAWTELTSEFSKKGVTLVAVSKTKPAADILELYHLGQRDFGENYVQELVEKQAVLPSVIRWHFIGHLQTNKVKYIAPFVSLIHTVDSFRLLAEINKQAEKCGRIINVLLQVYIAAEDTKFGLDAQELTALLDDYQQRKDELRHIRICGLMGMATNTENETQVRNEFAGLYELFSSVKKTYFSDDSFFVKCSMGMSSDYQAAIEAGSNMVRIGSLLFGSRVPKQ
jgi:pyridoxal phosphate enzyme (YggS family)